MSGKGIRVGVAALTLTVAGFAAYVSFEGWSPTAHPPVAADVATYGFGTTRNAAGQPLAGGEKITPVDAVRLAARDVQAHENEFRACLDRFAPGVTLHQHEWDAYMSLVLNVGAPRVCESTIPAKLRAREYSAACRAILDFNGYCTKPKVRNAAGKRVCPPGALVRLKGLTARRQAEFKTCMGE